MSNVYSVTNLFSQKDVGISTSFLTTNCFIFINMFLKSLQYSSSPSLYFHQEKERALYESNLKNIDEKVTYIGFYFSCLL